MSFLMGTFLRGLFTLLPVSMCIYFLYWFFSWLEQVSKALVLNLLTDPEAYIPGMGITFGVMIIFGFGILMSSRRLELLFSLFELPFKNVPIIKSIYSALKDLTGFFSPGKERKASKVVSVKVPGQEIQLVGFLTRSDLKALPNGIESENRVAVYLPMSYQIGGYTIFVPEEWVQDVDMSIEDAMKSALTAWLPTALK